MILPKRNKIKTRTVLWGCAGFAMKKRRFYPIKNRCFSINEKCHILLQFLLFRAILNYI